MKKIILIIATLYIGNLSVIAQEGRIKKADKVYHSLAYAEAVDYYNSILEQGVDSSRIAPQMADCYYEMRNPINAEKWYKVVVNNEPTPNDYFRYAQTLKGNGKYSKAATYMAKYNSLNATDSRAKVHVENVNYFVEMSEPSDRFILRNEENNSKNADFSPAYYGEKILFVSNRNQLGTSVKRQHQWNNEPFLNLFIADKGDQGKLQRIVPFSETLNTKFHEGPVAFTEDMKMMFFTRNNYLNGKKKKSADDIVKLKMYTSKKNDLGWSQPENFPYNSDEYSVGHPTLSPDGKTLYFASDMPGGYGGTDIWFCKKVGESWSKPENLGETWNSEGNEMFPFMHKDGSFYYSSDGLLGLGGLDIFECRAEAEKMGAPENLNTPVNSNKDDFGFIANMDKTEGYLSSNREGGKGNDDIYHFMMINKIPLTISGIVVDEENQMNPIEGARVRLIDGYDKVLITENMPADGAFKFDLDPEHCGYKIQVDNGELWSDYEYNNTPCDIEEGEISLGEIPLSQMAWSAKGIVTDKSTGQTVEGFNITFTDKATGEVISKVTSADGTAMSPLSGESDYKVNFEKSGYFAKSGEISTVGMESGIIEIARYIDLAMVPIEIGKGIKIENIYYDYDKSFIRKDAAIELDRIVQLLEDNPTIKVEMGSHTDARGSDVYNLTLSQRRAKAAMEYIISKGIAKSRMSWKGYGETILINQCKNGVTCDDQMHEQNRRTEFKVVGFVEGLQN